jgi:peptidoglycan/xylan/chitin deacetylase (PgdA/CDA1 family)
LVDRAKAISFSTLIISTIFVLMLVQPPASQIVFPQKETEGSPQTSCNCVAFRLDDVQDTFVDAAQVAAMEIFISKGQPLSLALIMNYIGNDATIVDKVVQGSKMGIFELGIHGWNHVDYTKLSASEQNKTLDIANNKMKSLFGNISQIFVPPYGYFNNDTLRVMNAQGIKILSATLSSEINFDKGRSIINYPGERASNLSGMSVKVNNDVEAPLPFHVPGLVSYKEYENGRPIKNPVGNMMKSVNENIEKYGYSVIILHPQDFAYQDANSNISDENRVNSTELNELSQVIDVLSSENKRITTLSEIVALTVGNRSYFT